jgi:hypothetical protein
MAETPLPDWEIPPIVAVVVLPMDQPELLVVVPIAAAVAVVAVVVPLPIVVR